MKQLIAIIALLAIILGSSSARAELIIYKGTEKSIRTDRNNGAPLNAKLFVIVDHDTGHFARIAYTILNGRKAMSTGLRTNTHIVQVVGVNGKSYTAVTFIPTDCQAQENPGVEGVGLKGLNAQLKISATSAVTFPKTMTELGGGLFHSSAGVPILDEYRRTMTFSPALTLASNTAGETLDTAFARLIDEVKAMGY